MRFYAQGSRGPGKHGVCGGEPESFRRRNRKMKRVEGPQRQGEGPEPFSGHLIVAAVQRNPRVETFFEMAGKTGSDPRCARRLELAQADFS